MTRSIVRAVLALLAFLALTGSARAQWSQPRTIATTVGAGTVWRQQVAFAADGHGVITWERDGEGRTASVFAADIRPDGSLSAPVRISRPSQRGCAPKLAVADSGQAAIVFSSICLLGTSSDEARKPRAVRLVTRAPGGAWSAPRVISLGGRNFSKSVAIEPSGRVVAAWTRQRYKHRPHVEIRRLSAGGGRSLGFSRLPAGTTGPRLRTSPAFPRAVLTYQVLADPDAGPRTLRLRVGTRDWRLDSEQDRGSYALAAGDRVLVAWGHGEATGPFQLRTAVLAPSDAKPRLEVRDVDAEGAVGSPTLATEGDAAVLTWSGGGDDTQVAQAQGGVFGAPADLSPDATDEGGTAALGGGRMAAALRGEHTFTPTADTAPILGAVGQVGGPFGAPTSLATEPTPDSLALAMSEDGSGALVYRTHDLLDPDGSTYRLRWVHLDR